MQFDGRANKGCAFHAGGKPDAQAKRRVVSEARSTVSPDIVLAGGQKNGIGRPLLGLALCRSGGKLAYGVDFHPRTGSNGAAAQMAVQGMSRKAEGGVREWCVRPAPVGEQPQVIDRMAAKLDSVYAHSLKLCQRAPAHEPAAKGIAYGFGPIKQDRATTGARQFHCSSTSGGTGAKDQRCFA